MKTTCISFLLFSTLCIHLSDAYYFPPPEGKTGRAAAAYKAYMKFQLEKSGKPRRLLEDPIERRARHHKWKLNEIDDEDDHETTTTTPFPITKSPQQIEAERQAEMRRNNPKNIKIFETTPTLSIDKKIKAMENKLKKLQERCETNSDCTNKTCCLIGQDGKGKCVVKPHKIGNDCSTDMCPCVNNLECKITELDQDKPGVITTVQKCAKKTIKEDSQEFIREFKNAIRKLKGCSTCRNKKTV